MAMTFGDGLAADGPPCEDEDAFLALIEDRMFRTYQLRKRQPAMIIAIWPSAKTLFHVLPGDMMNDKEGISNCLRLALREAKCSGYLFITELWLCRLDRVPEDNKVLAPSKDPGRIETLLLSGQMPSGRKIMRGWEIDRGRILEQVINGEGDEGSFRGLFIDLLEPAARFEPGDPTLKT